MSAATLSHGVQGTLSEIVDGVAERTGAWVVVERFGAVVTHGAGRGSCLPEVADALLTKTTLPLRAAVSWTDRGRHLRGKIGSATLTALELGQGGTAWFIDGTAPEDTVPLLAAALGDDDGPITDQLVESLLHPRGPARGSPAPPAVLLAMQTPGSLRALARAAVVASISHGARVHTDADCVVVAAPDVEAAGAISSAVRRRCGDATVGVAVVGADAPHWATAGDLARAAAATAARLGLGEAVVTAPAVTAELVISNAHDATASLARTLGLTPLTRIEEYDARTSGDLRNTLRVWCSAGFDTSAAAASLHVHVNTLRYRLRRASEISGLDLSNPRQVQALQLLLGD
jgi:hypothetical protein